VPDIITTANEGVVYTTGTKIAEHGGFGEEETHVALIVSGHGIAPRTFKSPVFTMQVAPTIVKALGLDPTQLQAVQAEGTAVLPGLPF
jgi:arylsulfatase A-like enzyme